MFLAKNNSAPKDSLKKPGDSAVSKRKLAASVPTRKLTDAQSKRLQALLAKSPAIENLDPQIYAKLQSAIHEAVEKTMPEYVQWLNSAFGEKIVADDCPTPDCSSCGNDCPTPVCSSCGNDCPTPACYSCGKGPTPVCNKCDTVEISSIDRIVDTVASVAINAAMSAAVNYTLSEAVSKEAGVAVSDVQMRNIVKKQLIDVANEIGKGT
jgi:hypothetical protein